MAGCISRMYNAAGCGVVLEGEVILASRADTTNACSCPLYSQSSFYPKGAEQRDLAREK